MGESSLKNEFFSKAAGNNRQILWPSQRSRIDVIIFIVTNHTDLTEFQQLVTFHMHLSISKYFRTEKQSKNTLKLDFYRSFANLTTIFLTTKVIYDVKFLLYCLLFNIYNHFHILRLLMFERIFLSPQVKRCAIIIYKHSIHELPHELLNYLRLRKLENIRKLSKFHRMIA